MHKRLTLNDNNDEPMRPSLSVWTETLAECEGAKGVVLTIGATHGAQERFVELTSEEAQKLAGFLIEAAVIAETFEAAQ